MHQKTAGLIFITSLLAGCATTPAPKVITQTKVVVVQTPEPLLKPCKISQPPTVANYMQEDMQQRENSLSNYILALIGDLKTCNHQIQSISTFQQQQLKLYSDPEGLQK